MTDQIIPSSSQSQGNRALQQAAFTADSISANLVQKNYAEVYQMLNSVASQKKQQFVFRQESFLRQIILIIASFAFLCVFGYILFFAVSTSVLSAEFRAFGLIASAVSAAAIVFNIFFMKSRGKSPV